MRYLQMLSTTQRLAFGLLTTASTTLLAQTDPYDESPQPSSSLELPDIRVQSEAQPPSATAPYEGYRAITGQSATKTDTPLNETSQSISVIGSAQIKDQGAQTLAEALRYSAGVNAGQRGRRGLDDFNIRGFTQSAYKFVDGMRMDSDMWIQSDPFAFERIEVLKGPASILYGQIAPGGVVNQVSKRPTAQPLAELGVGFGNYNQQRYTADLSDSLNTEGTLRYRLVALYSASDDIVDYVDRDRSYLAPSLTWSLSDDTELTFLASYQKSHYVPIRGLPAEGTVKHNPNGHISRNRFIGVPGYDDYTTEQNLIGYELTHSFSPNIRFTQKLRYNEYELDGAFSSPGTLSANKRNYSRTLQWRDVESELITLDNQLSILFGTGALNHDLLLGFDYFDFATTDVRHRSTLSAIDLYNPSYTVVPGIKTYQPANSKDETLTQKGFYLQDQIKLGDGWNLLLGLRHDLSKSATEPDSGTRTTVDEEASTGRIGLLYAFSNGWSPYISYSESFLPVSGSDVDGKAFEPETGEQSELGVKYESADQTFDITFALYELTRQNILTEDPSNTDYQIQIGEQRHRGAEVELHGQLTPQLSLIAGYSYIDAEITKSNDGNQGNRPTQVPKHMANLWLRYELSDWLPGLGIGAGVRHIGKQAGDDANSFDTPDYSLLDMAAYYETGPWYFQLNGNNLTDKDYIASCTSMTACYPGDPRTLLLSTRYTFK
jgi:iron complex outermembrane receptor protein